MLGLIVPTRNRPENALRLCEAVADTADPLFTKLMFVVDYDDEQKQDYLDMVPGWADVHVVPKGGPSRMGPVLNYAAKLQCENYSHIGFMGDDHVPRTQGWDTTLCDLLDIPGVAYGNDLFQGGKLPTAVIISAKIIRILGYMAPMNLKHLYLDNFWLQLGHVTNLFYAPDIIIEHMHPAAGKAAMDDSYALTNRAEQYSEDQVAYEKYLMETWPHDNARLQAELGL